MKRLNTWSSILLTLGMMTALTMPATAIAKEKQTSTVEKLISVFRPQPRPAGSRGGVCLLTPLEPEETLWNDRPLFIWGDKVSRIDVRSTTNQRVVWSQTLSSPSQSIVYQGEPLQPGQTYEVILYDPQGDRLIRNKDFYPSFTLIEVDRQQQIQTELAQKEERWRNNRDTIEAIALEKAIYFSEQKLWSDALQTLYSVPNPSLELRQFVQTTIQKACQNTNV